MKGKVGSDYAYRANVQKIDTECLWWFLGEQKVSIRKLAEKTSVTERTIRSWMKRGEMPAYLIEEICDALALETVCDMRESEDGKCAEPVTTFRYRDAKLDEDIALLHVRIGIEIRIPKELLKQILKAAINDDGTMSDLSFGDDTAALIMDKGKPAWDHYIPTEWLINDAIEAGLIKSEDRKEIKEAVNWEGG